MTAQSRHTLINTFTPKGETVEALLELQLEEAAKMRTKAAEMGWLSNEVFRTADGDRLIIVTHFRSEEAKEQWIKSPEFAEHLERITPLLECVDSTPVRLAGAFSGVGGDVPLRLAVITGSTREGRFADMPATWIAEKAEAFGGFEVSKVDLRDFDLPFFGDPRTSSAQKKAVEAFAPLIASFDAYLFTVAEYNHAPTAVLKNALDHAEWDRKPAGLVGYGGVGGARAVEHVRGIAAELQLVTMQAAVHINFGEILSITRGEKRLSEFEYLEDSAENMLGQLQWWGRALRAARIDRAISASN